MENWPKNMHTATYFGQTAKRGILKLSCRGNKQKLSLPNVREHHKLMKWKDIAVAQTRFATSATMPLFIIWPLIILNHEFASTCNMKSTMILHWSNHNLYSTQMSIYSL